jgi:hypothetical protein
MNELMNELMNESLIVFVFAVFTKCPQQNKYGYHYLGTPCFSRFKCVIIYLLLLNRIQ